jgi:excisionase family DNA binding protein
MVIGILLDLWAVQSTSMKPIRTLENLMDQHSSHASLLLRVDEAAVRLGLARSTVYQLLADGTLPVVRIGRAVRVPTAALDTWVAAQTVDGRLAGPDGRQI